MVRPLRSLRLENARPIPTKVHEFSLPRTKISSTNMRCEIEIYQDIEE